MRAIVRRGQNYRLQGIQLSQDRVRPVEHAGARAGLPPDVRDPLVL